MAQRKSRTQKQIDSAKMKSRLGDAPDPRGPRWPGSKGTGGWAIPRQERLKNAREWMALAEQRKKQLTEIRRELRELTKPNFYIDQEWIDQLIDLSENRRLYRHDGDFLGREMEGAGLEEQAAINLMTLDIIQASDRERARAARYWKQQMEMAGDNLIDSNVVSGDEFEQRFRSMISDWGRAARNLVSMNLPVDEGGSAEMFTAKDRDMAIEQWKETLGINYDPDEDRWFDTNDPSGSFLKKKKKAKKDSQMRRRRWPQVRPYRRRISDGEWNRRSQELDTMALPPTLVRSIVVRGQPRAFTNYGTGFTTRNEAVREAEELRNTVDRKTKQQLVYVRTIPGSINGRKVWRNFVAWRDQTLQSPPAQVTARPGFRGLPWEG